MWSSDGERRIPGCMYDCVGMQDDSYPSCNTCEEYVKCKDGKPTISHCPEGEHYDSKSQTCKDQDQADCVMYPDQDHDRKYTRTEANTRRSSIGRSPSFTYGLAVACLVG